MLDPKNDKFNYRDCQISQGSFNRMVHDKLKGFFSPQNTTHNPGSNPVPSPRTHTSSVVVQYFIDHVGLMDRGRTDHGRNLVPAHTIVKRWRENQNLCVNKTIVKDRYCMIAIVFIIAGARIRNDLHANGLRYCSEQTKDDVDG